MSVEKEHKRILIDQYFEIIVENKASDLHLQEGQPPKMRLHGDIMKIREEPLTRAEMKQMLSEVVGPKRWEKYEESGDVDCAYELNADARFRCNLHKHLHGYGGIFRLIPNKIATLEQLKVPTVIKKFANIRGGLVLVTGPTGSGKSTTLAALIDYINSSYSRHIITIEEPIEFVHQNKLSIITQREVGEDTPSFADGLKNAMREDADVVLVGEMRDLETIALALTAAETGMLVFGTLHTNNARKTVDRMIDVFPSSQQPQVRTMLSASLRGIVAQLLMKKSDGKGPRGRERDSHFHQCRVVDHPRGCGGEADRRAHQRQGRGHAVHGRRHQFAAAKRYDQRPRGLYEGDRQGPLRAVSQG